MRRLKGEGNSLDELDILAGDQFYSSWKNKLDENERLMLAVLEEALTDYKIYALMKDCNAKALFRNAANWINDRDEKWPYSFNNICGILDINPERLRSDLYIWLSKRKSN